MSSSQAVLGTLSYASMQPIPGMGYGLVATKAIRKGAVILSEPPLLTLRNGASIAEFCDTYQRLTEDARRQFDRLYFNPQKIKPTAGTRREFENWYTAQVAKKRFPPGNANEVVRKLLEAYETFWTNAANMEEEAVSLVFPTFSRANHSCDPNTTVVINRIDAGIYMQVSAKWPIQAGEQVFVTYVAELGPRTPRALSASTEIIRAY
ncbi:hypothetical protein GGR54DRAFT_644536 [Hypoxylon sp. NC1633]|nr:hypothetical protein GGR54DRAFT_644536 [Hypoxylon sp. NC1633]